MVFWLWWKNKITNDERRREFYGVEWSVHVEHAEPGQFSQYIPTDMKDVKKDTKVSLLDITQAKVRLGMYPIQKMLSQLFNKDGKNT